MRRSLWLLAALAAAIYFVIRVRSILTPFLLGAVIAYLVYPLVQLFEQRFVPRAAAILLVYTVIGFVLGGLWVTLRSWSEVEEIISLIHRRQRGGGQGGNRAALRASHARSGKSWPV